MNLIPLMTNFSAWYILLLAPFVLLIGEFILRRSSILSRFNIPTPVIGGMLVALVVLVLNLTGVMNGKLNTTVTTSWWSWFVTIETEWMKSPAVAVDINRPLLVAFFTCIGLNASWELAKKGSTQVVVFLVLATVLSVAQNILGVGLAYLLDVSPILGLACGSISLTGGHGTVAGFVPELEKAGLANAKVLGIAAATFGLVSGSLLGGPVGGSLIRKYKLKPTATGDHSVVEQTSEAGLLLDLKSLVQFGKTAVLHLLLLIVCLKVGAWASYFIQKTGATFPVYIGAMLVGVLIRNACDFSKWRWIKNEVIDAFAAVLLGLFLSIAMMSLNLAELVNAAVPMLVILVAQVILMFLFAYWVTYHFMGRDHDAAVMAAGHCGFGLGATSNAMANMKSLVETFGPAPRAFIVVPIVGACLADFTNALNITFFLNILK
jgi:glutamate:Na+ symporter, ESS family